MPVTRDQIITTLQAHLQPDPNILALWLEGADAAGCVDAYSDIDLCCSVRPGPLESAAALARRALESLGRLDLAEVTFREADCLFSVFHLEGTSPYWLLDFDVFVNRGSQFTLGDEIERPLILFDKAGVVQFLPPRDLPDLSERLASLENTVAQEARIEKYILRGDFLEAFGYYHKWLLTPLIEALRMRYTPLHPDYYIVHISRHLPPESLRRLEDLFKVSSLAEMDAKRRQARAFFDETARALRSIKS